MDWKWSEALREGMSDAPFLELAQIEIPDTLRNPSDSDMELAMPSKGHSLKTWGRTAGTLTDDPHWIGVKRSTPLHFDPKYPRYTHHLMLRVDERLRLRGYDKNEVQLSRGTYFVMDGHSPHQMFSEPRGGVWYFAVSIDAHEPREQKATLEKLFEYAESAPFFTPDLKMVAVA